MTSPNRLHLIAIKSRIMPATNKAVSVETTTVNINRMVFWTTSIILTVEEITNSNTNATPPHLIIIKVPLTCHRRDPEYCLLQEGSKRVQKNFKKSIFCTCGDSWPMGPNSASGSTAALYKVSQEECARLREGVPYVKVYRYNPKHLSKVERLRR